MHFLLDKIKYIIISLFYINKLKNKISFIKETRIFLINLNSILKLIVLNQN